MWLHLPLMLEVVASLLLGPILSSTRQLPSDALVTFNITNVLMLPTLLPADHQVSLLANATHRPTNAVPLMEFNLLSLLGTDKILYQSFLQDAQTGSLGICAPLILNSQIYLD